MEYELKIFKNDTFGELQVIKSGEDVYFEATKCAALLGFPCTGDCVYKYCFNKVKFKALDTLGDYKLKNFIPKEDVINLVKNSTSPISGKFKKWIFDEIIPSYKEKKKQPRSRQKNISEKENKSLLLSNPNSRFLNFLKRNNIELGNKEIDFQNLQTTETIKFKDANGSCMEYTLVSMPFQASKTLQERDYNFIEPEEENSPALTFWNEAMVARQYGENTKSLVSEVFKAFRLWCEENNIKCDISSKKFSFEIDVNLKKKSENLKERGSKGFFYKEYKLNNYWRERI